MLHTRCRQLQHILTSMCQIQLLPAAATCTMSLSNRQQIRHDHSNNSSSNSNAPLASEGDPGRATTDDTAKKLYMLKCTKATPSPVSQAIAFMLGKDLMPEQQLRSNMAILCQQLQDNVASYSSTEMSAFAEACRKIGYRDSPTFNTIMQQLAPNASNISADELPSLLWAASTLAVEAAASPTAMPSTSANTSSTDNSSSTSTSSNGGGGSGAASKGGGSTGSSTSLGPGPGPSSSRNAAVPVPQNDGVVGSINSSRLLGLPSVLEFVLGASQALAGDLDAIGSEELPVVAAALADMEYRDPFLLTVLAECVLERKPELSEGELLQLISNFAAMGCWFFDNRLLDQLTVELIERAKAGSVGRDALVQVAHEFAAINHRNKALQQYLQE